MDAHYDRVSQNSYELCIMHLHYALGVHIVYYVICNMYCVLRTATGSQHRLLCIMYYVLCVLCTTHWESNRLLCITYYVLCIMYYALGRGSPHRMLCIMYYVLCMMRHTLRTYNPSQLMAARAAAPVRAHKGGWGGDA